MPGGAADRRARRRARSSLLLRARSLLLGRLERLGHASPAPRRGSASRRRRCSRPAGAPLLARRPTMRQTASPLPRQRSSTQMISVPLQNAEVAAGEAAQRPAHRLVGAAEMQQVLLGLVRVVPDRLGERRAARRSRAPTGSNTHQPLQPVQPPAGDAATRCSSSPRGTASRIASAVRQPCA